MDWTEFRLWYGEKIDIQKLYNLRKLLLPILDEHEIEYFLVLNEPKFVLFRVEVEEDIKKEIKKSLDEIVKQSEGTFSKVTDEKWNPEKDALDRIIGASKRIGLKLEEGKGWMIVGREPLNQNFVVAIDDLDMKIKEFSTFMTRVAGKFTRAYFEQMPRKIIDKWMLSVLFHLLINSLSYNQIEEEEIRKCPYL